jgi:hypothetical protein
LRTPRERISKLTAAFLSPQSKNSQPIFCNPYFTTAERWHHTPNPVDSFSLIFFMFSIIFFFEFSVFCKPYRTYTTLSFVLLIFNLPIGGEKAKPHFPNERSCKRRKFIGLTERERERRQAKNVMTGHGFASK